MKRPKGARHASDRDVRRRRRPDRERPRSQPGGADRRDHARHSRLHLRQRPVAVRRHGAERDRPVDGPRGDRRRRGRRRGGRARQAGRPRGDAVRVLRRHLRVLPRGSADRLRARRLLRQQRHERRAGRGAAHPVRRRHPVHAAGRRGRRADAVAADALRRDGHRPPRRGRGAGSRRADASPSSATARSACAA